MINGPASHDFAANPFRHRYLSCFNLTFIIKNVLPEAGNWIHAPKASLSPLHPACFPGRIRDLQLPRRPSSSEGSRPETHRDLTRELSDIPGVVRGLPGLGVGRCLQCIVVGSLGTMCRCAEKNNKTTLLSATGIYRVAVVHTECLCLEVWGEGTAAKGRARGQRRLAGRGGALPLWVMTGSTPGCS